MAKKAKYKIKQGSGSYEIIHFETSVDQIVQSREKQFITQEEKEQIALKANQDYVEREMKALKSENAELKSLIQDLSEQLSQIQSSLNKAKTRIAWTTVKN